MNAQDGKSNLVVFVGDYRLHMAQRIFVFHDAYSGCQIAGLTIREVTVGVLALPGSHIEENMLVGI